MSHENKTKEQLIAELSELRQRIVEMETLQVQYKQVDEALKGSEEKYSTIVEKGNDGIAIAQYGKVRFANSKLLELFGFTLEETVEKPFIDFITPESRELIMERYKKRITGEQIPNTYEIELHTKDGRKIPVEINASLIEYEGKPADLAIIRNISDRRKVEDSLRESELRYRGLYESSIDGIVSSDLNGYILECNQAFTDMLGYTKEELFGKDYQELIPSKWRNIIKTIVKEQIFLSGFSDEYKIEHVKKDGTIFPISGRGWLINDKEGNPIGIWGIIRDITEQQRSKDKIKNYTENLEKMVDEKTKALRESEERLKAILTGIGALITIQNKDLDVIWANMPIRALWGEVIGQKCYKVYKGLTEPCPDCTVEKVFKEGKTTVSERVSTLPDGTQMHILVTSSPVRDAEGNIVAVVEVDKDITEQKKLEQELKNYTVNLENIVDTRTKELKESEEKLNAILTGIADLITIQNRDLDIIWVNQPMSALYGDIVGRKCFKVYKRLDEPCEDCYVESVFIEGKTVISERESILPDGSLIHVFITSSPIRDAEGNIVAILEVEKDITEQKKLERKLVESEAKQQAILSAIGDRITIQNKNLDIIWANQVMKDIYGDVIGQKCYKAYKWLTEPCPDCTVEKVLNEEKTVVSEGIVIRPDGGHSNILTTSSPVRDAEGNIVGVLEVVKDITERKHLEVELRQSEERYRGLYESSIDGIVSLDTDGNIVECNQAYANLLGYSKEELYALTVYDLTPNKLIESNKKFHNQLLTVGYSEEFEKEYIKKDGSFVSIASRGWPIKNEEEKTIGMWGIVRDITERKQVEKKIKEYTENLEKLVEERTLDLKVSEEHYRGLYESSIDGIASLDMDGNIIECNQAYANMLGYTKEELYNLSYQDLTPDRWYDMETEKVTKQILAKGYSNVYEKEHIKKDGTIFPVSVRDWLIKDKESTPTGMWTIVRDISEQKKMERQLKKYTEDLEASEKRYRGLYESSLDGIVFLDLEGNILECNQAFADMLEYTKKQLYNSNYRELFPSKLFDYVAKTLSDQMFTSGYSDELETEAIKQDGTIISVSVKAWRIKDKENKPIGTWTIVRDITEQKKLESQLKNYAENLEKLVEKRTEKLRESEERYRGLYKSSADGIFSADLERNIIECNQAFADMLGYTKEELYELNFRDLTPRKWFDLVNGRIRKQVYTRGYSEEYEQEAIKKDGSIVPVSVRVWWVKDKTDRPIGMWGIIRDITERKRAEGKIKEYTENLEKLVEERTLELKELERRYSQY